MDALPIEVLDYIFNFFEDDSLQACEKVCKKWARVITCTCFYARKCERLLKLDHSLTSTFNCQKFDTEIRSNPEACKKFYYGLKQLPARWVADAVPQISSFYCKSGEVSESWIRNHNYTGVYDMVWLPEQSYLICSVYDTIQIWDMAQYKRINVIEASLLDSDREKTTSFHASGPALITGTSRGRLQAFDLTTSKLLGETTPDPNVDEMVCDIKGFKNRLLSTDWRGLLAMWRWKLSDKGDIEFLLEKRFYPKFPDDDDRVIQKYKSRFGERLIDFNDYIGVTNCHDMFCIFDVNKQDFATWIKTERSVLCCQVFENSAYWGGPGGRLFHYKQTEKNVVVIESNDELEKYVTKYEDSITSVTVSKDKIIFGDVNAEIHCLTRDPKTPLGQNSFRFMLESGHAYKSFIWALEIDSSRIFSGDSNGCLVVHDFWKDDEEASEPESKRPKLLSGH